MRRLFWVGVGVAVTVVVIRKGRSLAAEYLPAGTTEIVDGATRLTRAWNTARAEFTAGVSERSAELMHDLVGDADVDELRAQRPQHVDELRHRFRPDDKPKVPAHWAGPTEDPDDDGDAAFF
ncbi:hypothetical protein [Cellulomonas rhizosphaerae]|uniref:Uncharacterized protein n=1 Tax=Cellulomonas rhizosphaerae TaxID=2293719 RepID=A0A413RLE5_9CELL|nr:hypothetical protein [Cellulomonas rhizosphaerae]RHA40524.1 hypothetical protein D1825_09995 [Cellulomonas rhizosphaerae]